MNTPIYFLVKPSLVECINSGQNFVEVVPVLKSATTLSQTMGLNVVGIDMSQRGHPLFESLMIRLRARHSF